MPSNSKQNHCSNCGFEIKVVTRKASIVFYCLECGRRIPTDTKICKNDGDAGYYKIEVPETEMRYKCKQCGHKSRKKSSSTKTTSPEDALFKKIKFNRKFINRSMNDLDDEVLVKEFIRSLKYENDLATLRDFLLPTEILSNIATQSNSDKWVEKSQLRNIIYWFFSTFMVGNLESLQLKMVSERSKNTVSRKLTDNAIISPNALGERLVKDNVVEGLCKIFEYTVARSKTKVFDNSLSLKPVFYDWMYITKSGNAWQICNEMPRSDNFHGFKIGIGNDWNSKSIVSLVFHGQEHPNDTLSFERDLRIDDAAGIINIVDRGPFDTNHLAQINKEGQFFIIRLKKNLKVIPIHLKKHNNGDFLNLNIASKPKIKLLQSGVINLPANPDLGNLKYVKFQYNNEKNGRFETIELISNLQLDTIEIIELSAQRWRLLKPNSTFSSIALVSRKY